MTAILEVRDVVKSYGGIHAVSGVSFDLQPGEVLGLVGPNGAGKTTLLNVLSGFVPASHGTVHHAGRDVTKRSAHARSRKGLVRTFQHSVVAPSMTVAEAARLSSFTAVGGHRFGGLRGLFPTRASDAAAATVLADLELEPWATHRCADLPYGVKKRVGIAMALLMSPSVLLLDEPAAGLNSHETLGLGEMIAKIAAAGCAVVLVEHDLGLVRRRSDRILVLDHGEQVAIGLPESVLNDERVIGAYVGH